jgi:hypothetical protein
MALYGGENPGAQLGLFDAPEPAPPSAPLTTIDDADDENVPPPYVWD